MIKNNPALWNSILSRFPEGCVIAGGAIRDYFLNVEPKDFDVFGGLNLEPEPVEAEPGELVDFSSLSDPRCGLDRVDNDYERTEEYEKLSNIQLVSQGTIGEHKVDYIVLTEFVDGKELVEGFDFGINRCWFDGKFIHYTEEFLQDWKNKTVTLLKDDRKERSLKRFKSFAEGHGDHWRLVDKT